MIDEDKEQAFPDFLSYVLYYSICNCKRPINRHSWIWIWVERVMLIKLTHNEKIMLIIVGVHKVGAHFLVGA